MLVAGGTRPLEDVLLEPPGAIRLAELVESPGEHAGHQEHVEGVASLVEKAHALLPELLCGLVVLIVGGGVTEKKERSCRAPVVSQLAVKGERFLGPLPGACRVPVPDLHVRRGVEGF